jgi:hypothetical protein
MPADEWHVPASPRRDMLSHVHGQVLTPEFRTWSSTALAHPQPLVLRQDLTQGRPGDAAIHVMKGV